MRLLNLLFISCILSPLYGVGQLISIDDARAQPVGSTVTINGIVTSGPEFGTIRYMQDGTGGMAIFSSALATAQRGDDVTVTGVTVQFNNLLEITPVNSWTLNSTGNPLPPFLNLTPSQLNEFNESMLVRITNVTFTTGGTFQSNGTYTYTSNGESGQVFIRSTSPIVGQPIPTSSIILYGLNSQYGSQYQVIPRDMNDLVLSNVISITEQPSPLNITNSGFFVSWATSMAGNAFMRYGLTPSLELGTLTGGVNISNPVIAITNAQPATVYYTQVYSVNGIDTAISGIRPFITASNSSGIIKAYFDREVDNSAASPSSNLAVHLNNTFDDTLKAYMDRAVSTLDIAIYSFDDSGTALIIQAINDAHDRGVRVRMVVEAGNVNAGLLQLNPAIQIQPSPTSSPFYYGIMHNKFFIADANDSDPHKPIVMSGSTNWSNTQLSSDRNNLVFIQDQSLARVYTMEFEEMWGGNGDFPVPSNAKFGPDKKDNTPHILNVGGKIIESYFSPSDYTHEQILRTVTTANNDIFFATMVFTRFDIAEAMEDRIVNNGVFAAGIVNDSSGGSGVSFLILDAVIGNNMMLYDHPSQTGILHHKYMIVDQSNTFSDPLVLTGSHNWSSAATQRNDENTLIIHDALIANQYYQEFHNLFNSNGGALGIENNIESNGEFLVFPNPTQGEFSIVYSSEGNTETKISINDISGKIVFESLVTSKNGLNEIEIDQQNLSKGIYFVKVGDSKISKIVLN